MIDELEADPPPATEPDDAPSGPTLDPLSRWLLMTALALAVLLLVTSLFVVLFVFSLRSAPRTNAEYTVSVNQAAVAANPSDAGAWAKLAYAYAAMRRYPLALSTAEQGRAATGSDSLLLVRADILRESGDNRAALSAYDKAYTETSAAIAAANQKLKSEGIYVPLGSDSALAPVLYGRALTKHALGDTAGAIGDLRAAVKISPTEANLWVTLGDYESQAGAFKDARAAYSSALTFVPGMPQALAGLAALQKGGH